MREASESAANKKYVTGIYWKLHNPAQNQNWSEQMHLNLSPVYGGSGKGLKHVFFS